MAVEGTLTGLFVGMDHVLIYTDADFPPTNMAGWTVILDVRLTDDAASPPLLTKTGVVSGTYSATRGANTQIVTFTLTAVNLGPTTFPGDPPNLRYSICRTNSGNKQPLRYGSLQLTRVTQA